MFMEYLKVAKSRHDKMNKPLFIGVTRYIHHAPRDNSDVHWLVLVIILVEQWKR